MLSRIIKSVVSPVPQEELNYARLGLGLGFYVGRHPRNPTMAVEENSAAWTSFKTEKISAVSDSMPIRRHERGPECFQQACRS